MKKFRLSRLVMLCLGVALAGVYAAQSFAEATYGERRTVGDMMSHRSGRSSSGLSRRNGYYPSRHDESEYFSGTNARSGANSRSGVFASRSRNAFSGPDKDGSLFPGGSCVNCMASDDKDGSLFPGGPCVNCHDSGPLIEGGSCTNCRNSGPLIDTGPCKTCRPLPEPEPVVEEPEPPVCQTCIQPKTRPAPVIVRIPYMPVIERPLMRNCCAMAPLTLEHVDFNLTNNYTATPYGQKLGNYRFRIFGCRRYDKEAILNRGRIMQKDMNFNKVFEEVTGDCYNLVDMPKDLCLQNTPSPLPEYVLTAEISDFFMNVCDQYDWNTASKSNERGGSAEMKVTWRLSNPTKTKVVWEGTTTGYSEIDPGTENGEIRLIEDAFADAVGALQMAYGFEDQLMVRLTPEELSAERNALIDEEIAQNPAKCNYREELQYVKKCQISRPEFAPTECPRMRPQPVVIEAPRPQPIIVEEPRPAPCTVEVPCDQPTPCVVPAPCPAPEPEVMAVEDVPEPPAVVIEDSGVTTDYKMFDNCIDEKGGVISNGQCMVVDDTWVDVKQDVVSIHDLCIVDRPPYEQLTPENLYKVRASVVEITAPNGKKGAGLIISDTFVLTSANLADKSDNTYRLRTINGKDLTGRIVRINPSKNTALIMLDQDTEYTPLSLNMDLPDNGRSGYHVLGMLDVANFQDGENYLDDNGKIVGIRYTDDQGAEIIVDTAVQQVTIGGVLIDGHGTINGIAHTGDKTESGNDLFLPTETALRSVGLKLCEKLYEKSSPWQQTVYKPVTEMIMTAAPKAPEVLKKSERK